MFDYVPHIFVYVCGYTIPVLELWGIWSTPSLLLLPSPLILGVVLPTMVPFVVK